VPFLLITLWNLTKRTTAFLYLKQLWYVRPNLNGFGKLAILSRPNQIIWTKYINLNEPIRNQGQDCFYNAWFLILILSSLDSYRETENGHRNGILLVSRNDLVHFDDFVRVFARLRPMKRSHEKNRMNTREKKLKCKMSLMMTMIEYCLDEVAQSVQRP
jgi:hypothetical protein